MTEQEQAQEELAALREISSLRGKLKGNPGANPTTAQVLKENIPEAGPATKTLGAMGATALSGIGNFGLDAVKAGLQSGPLGQLLPKTAVDAGARIADKTKERLNAWEAEHSNITGFGNTALKGLSTGLVGGLASMPAKIGLGSLANPAVINTAVNPMIVGAGGVAGAAGGVSADLAGHFIDPKQFPTLSPVAQALAGLLAGGATGYGLGPRQSPAKATLREKLDLTPAELGQTAANAANFKNTGSTSATLADAVPGDNLLKSLARTLAASPGGEALANRLKTRPDDLRGMGDNFLERLGPRVNAPEVANQAAAAANGAMASLKEARSAGVANRLSGQTVDAWKVANVYNDLLDIGKAEVRPESGEAFRKVANSLLDQNGHLITDAQQLNLAVKALKTAAKNPNAPVTAGQSVIPAVDLGRAISAAETGIEAASPPIAGAMKDFRDFSRGPMEDMRKGSIGSLSDRNPLTAGETRVSRLNTALVGDNEASTIFGTARVFSAPELTQGKTVNPTDIARAIAQTKLKNGSTNPGQAVRGFPGSDAEKQLDALIQAGGKDPVQVRAPLAAADALQGLETPTSIKPDIKMHLAQALVRPFRYVDMSSTLSSNKKMNLELARLIAEPNPENLAHLRELLRFDPAVRKQLSGISAVIGADSAKKE